MIERSVARRRELADHGREVGVPVLFELDDGASRGAAVSALNFLADIGRPVSEGRR
jgi:hypothetical protein